ncbi:hypothetical protein ACJ41O_007653 [Fusarium nematophilum]
MSINDVSCFLCGAPIDNSVDVPDWMGQFRALYTVLEDWGDARISGVGRRQRFKYIIPLDQSLNVDLSESIVDDTWVRIALLKSAFDRHDPQTPPAIPQTLWGFPLHDRCWDLLCSTDTCFRSQSTVQALFDICRSQPVGPGMVDWGHNYDGLAGYDVDIETLFPGEEARLARPWGPPEDRTDEYDPMSYLGCLVPPYTEGTLTISRNAGQEPEPVPSAGSDPLGLLPPELLVDIFVQSKSRDVANLRLASKAIANIGLSDAFWYSRFWPGREFEHVFELVDCHNVRGQWRTIYDRARSLKSLPAMENRQRVWGLACRLRDLVALRLESPSCHGSLYKSFFNPSAEDDGRVWRTAQSAICPATKGFFEGSRSLYDSEITLAGLKARAWASLVTLNGKDYISGLRLAKSSGDVIQLGYRHPHHEFAFTWDDSSEAPASSVGFQVAVDARGIRGLCLLSAQGARSRWVGDHQGVPKKSIICVDSASGQTEAIQGVKGGFDALKMVSISVHGLGHKKEKSARREVDKTNPGVSALWHPEPPDPALQLWDVRDRRLSIHLGHLPYSMCLFGGRDGRLLPHLTDITVWINDRSALGIYADKFKISALEFHYSSPPDASQSMMLGRVPDIDPWTSQRRRYNISIDSRNGERICGVDTMYQDHRYPFALTLHTSHGRSVQFPPDFSEQVPEHDYFTYTLRPTEGTIVGLFSVLKHNVGFQNIGVACIP